MLVVYGGCFRMLVWTLQHQGRLRADCVFALRTDGLRMAVLTLRGGCGFALSCFLDGRR